MSITTAIAHPVSRGVLFALLLAGGLYVGSRRVGPVPPLGPFLEPTRGFWTVALAAELPDSASAVVPGLASRARVLYDGRSVPHIFAESVDDAIRALGFVVARDRLFQLELQTRATAGTLTELVGLVALETDRSQRVLGLAWSAERSFDALDPESPVSRAMRAYADGINAWIARMGAADVPLGYHLVGARPARWLPQYSFYLLKRMGWTLSYIPLEQRKRAAAAVVGWEAADALFPVNSPIQEPIQTNGLSQPRLDFVSLPPPGEPVVDGAMGLRTGRVAELLALEALSRSAAPLPLGWWGSGAGPTPAAPGERDGAAASNNWAVMPIKTENGTALLAGDPHLDLTLPSIWYEAHLVVPGELDVYGATIPGVPVIIIGFNRDVAWSFTNTGADVMDLYAETFDDLARPTAYLLDGEWRPLSRRIEVYRSPTGGVIAVDTVYHTHRGPVLANGAERLSLRWTVLDEQTEELTGFLAAARAGSVDEWLEGMEAYSAPAQNAVVADRNGSIAIRSTGRFPIRPPGVRGDTILDGTTTAGDWEGSWPVHRYPYSIDPPQGHVASANQQPIDPRVVDEYLGADWPSPWRAMRINQLLRERGELTPSLMERMQTDPGSARADLFVPVFLGAARRAAANGGDDELLSDAARLLGEWDRRYTRDNERAILFEYAMSELEARTWDELEPPPGDRVVPGRIPRPGTDILAELLHDSASVWWDDRRTDELEDRDAVLNAALRAALGRARTAYGSETAGGWRWERIRHANIYHLLGIPSLSALELPIQGGPGTINPSSGGGRHGASWRMVVELGPEVRAWATYPGGQSENPASTRYADRIQQWVDGELAPVLLPSAPAELPPDRVTSFLMLRPEP